LNTWLHSPFPVGGDPGFFYKTNQTNNLSSWPWNRGYFFKNGALFQARGFGADFHSPGRGQEMRLMKPEKFAIVACESEFQAVLEAVKEWGAISLKAIGSEGAVTQCDRNREGMPVYFCHIEFAGALEPRHATRGLAILPEVVIYNGMASGFLECLRSFTETPSLHRYAAIYMEPKAILKLSGDGLECLGQGSIAICLAPKEHGEETRVLQFRPGESVPSETFRSARKVY
jgi:hypothetical protein